MSDAPICSPLSPLGTTEEEHEAFRCALMELVADKVTPELGAIPAFGPLGAALRETPVYLHSLPSLKALSTHALTDGNVIFVASETLHQHAGPVKTDIVSLGLCMRSILQAVAIRAHNALKDSGAIAGPCYAFPHAVLVASHQLRQALESDAPELSGAFAPLSPEEAEQEKLALVEIFRHPYPRQASAAAGPTWKQMSDALLSAPSMEALSRQVALPAGIKPQIKTRLQRL